MGQSLEKYRDVKLQQFRSQLPMEDAHVRKIFQFVYNFSNFYGAQLCSPPIQFTLFLMILTTSCKTHVYRYFRTSFLFSSSRGGFLAL